jgi:hypothetical protein
MRIRRLEKEFFNHNRSATEMSDHPNVRSQMDADLRRWKRGEENLNG